MLPMTEPETSPHSLDQKKQPRQMDEEKEKLFMALQATFIVAARILAIRLFLFLSLAGSFVLAIIATYNGSPQSAWVNLLYAGVTTLPLTILEYRGKHGG